MAKLWNRVALFFLSFRKRTLRTRLLTGFVLIALMPVLSATAFSLTIGLLNWRQQSFERLETVADSKEEAILRWADSIQQKLAIAANSDCGYDRINVVISLAKDAKYLQFYNRVVRNHFLDFLAQSKDLQELALTDSKGLILLSTNAEQEGQVISKLPQGYAGFSDPYISISPDSSTIAGDDRLPQVLAGAPVTGLSDQEVGQIIARPRLDRLIQILNDHTGLGKTGRSYLVSREGIVLADSRLQSEFKAGQGFSFTASEGLQQAIQSGKTVAGTFRDFRNRHVLGVYRWLPDLGVSLVVEQDQIETYASIFETLGINLVVVSITLVIAVSLSLVIVRDIVRPLTELADTASRIASGDLHRVAQIQQDDEIGILAHAFNSMTSQLRELIANLETRVGDRTRDLERLALQLETSARVGREITSILEINELLGKISELIQTAFGYYGVHIFLADEQGGRLIYTGKKDGTPYQLELEIGAQSLNGKAALLNQAVLANDVKQDPSYQVDPCYPNTQAELVVPLRFGSRVIGTLDILATEKGIFSPDDVLVAQSLGDQIAIAIENARLYNRSRELAVLEERNRMARELHDSMNQSLYSVILFTGAARNEAGQLGAASILNHLERAENMAKQALKEMRLLVYELRPLELEEKGFLGALQQRLDTVEGRAGIDVELVLNQNAPMPPVLEENLFRIVQEALNNIVKHSNATRVTIQIDVDKKWCKLRVVDNGIGFDPSSAQYQHGMGLVNMRERALELGGELQICSAPQEGTCIELAIDTSKFHPIQEQS